MKNFSWECNRLLLLAKVCQIYCWTYYCMHHHLTVNFQLPPSIGKYLTEQLSCILNSEPCRFYSHYLLSCPPADEAKFVKIQVDSAVSWFEQMPCVDSIQRPV